MNWPIINALAPEEAIGVLALMAVAVALDVKHRTIPNWLTVSGALGGMLYHLLRQGPLVGLAFSSEGLLLGISLLCPPFVLGKSGGGDVKLLGAMGAWLGPGSILACFLYSALAGGVMALFHLRFGHAAERLALQFKALGPAAAVNRVRKLPYSLPMAAGYLAYLVKGAPL
jgi:prepilin peptidase CpaA